MTIEQHTTGSSLTLHADQDFWNERQLAALAQIGVDRAAKGDLAVFMHVAQRTGLDPFARQIHMIERQGKWTIQTGIDGFRLVARRAVDRSGETLSIGESQWADASGAWSDVWLSDEPPAAARVTVYRDGQAFVGTALWREYVQTRRDGNVTSMWATRGAGQLAKCAEALALRKAFPMDLAGVYTTDEMEREQPASPRTGGLGAALNGSEQPATDQTDDGEPDADQVTGEVVEPEGEQA